MKKRSKPDFKDRKTGLVVFGILQIIFGGFCLLMVPFMIFGMIASAVFNKSFAVPMRPAMMILALLLYVSLAVWFICMGFGSIKARRWARALILVSSWLWLICGTSGLIFILLLMPDIYDRMGESEQIPPEFARIMKYVMAAFMTVLYVLIPAVFVLFYGSKNVKATCEFRDPQIRWTDKCPLPVLALSLIFGSWAVSMLFTVFYRCVIPFFGFILTGLSGAGVLLLVMLLAGYIAWGTYRLSINAWWCAVVLIIAWASSAAITFSRVSLLDYYEKMNFSQQQLDIMKQFSISRHDMALFLGLWAVAFLCYLLYTRRYFVHPPEQLL
jgi:hypothetical protein